MTGAPPIAIGLFDQSCTAKSRMEHPALYKNTQNSEFFNHKVFWQWICLSVFHSVVLYWMPLLMYTDGIVWSTGMNGDYLVLGNTVYSCVILTVSAKAALVLDSWNWLTHLSIWGSIAFWFTFLVVYSYFWVIGIPMAANMAGIIVLISSMPMFWLSMLLVPLTALMPDIVSKTYFMTAEPTQTDLVRMAEKKNRNIDVYVQQPNAKFARFKKETTALLRTAKDRVFRKGGGRGEDGRRRNSSEEMEFGTRPTTGRSSLHQQPHLGFAFSQEEGGAISQTEATTRYGQNPKVRHRSAGLTSSGRYEPAASRTPRTTTTTTTNPSSASASSTAIRDDGT